MKDNNENKNNIENNLKPCPICNSTENIMVYTNTEQIPDKKTNMHTFGVVECTKLSCRVIIKASTIEEAVKRWNKRPREDFLLEQNKALTEQLVIDEIIENDLRTKLLTAIGALEYYIEPYIIGKEKIAIEALTKIKEEDKWQI